MLHRFPITVTLPALLASTLTLTVPLLSLSVQANPQTQQVSIQVPSGTLEQALNSLGQQASIIMIFSPELTKGQNSKGLNGTYTIEQALATLLKNTDIHFSLKGNTATLIKADSNVMTFDTIKVIGTAPQRYEATTASSATGIEVSLMDTPRSIQVIPEQIILDQQAQDL